MIEDIDLLYDKQDMFEKLGRQPTTTDIRNGISKYSLNTFSRHFGGYRNALKAFMEYVDGKVE